MANPVTYCRNQGLLVILFMCWFALNGFLFTWCYTTLRFDDRFHYMYLMLGETIFLARGTGLLLNFNCALVLLPMNRYINSWIRCHLLKNAKGTVRRLFDHTKGIHITIALAICFLSVVHTVLHVYNYFNFDNHFTTIVPDINLAKSKDTTTLPNFFATIPGFTGVVMMFILFLLFVHNHHGYMTGLLENSISSFKAVRRMHHNLFGFLHYFSLVFVVLMAFHGFGKLTKFQTNLKEHPIQCHSLEQHVQLPECRANPSFDYVRAASWKWLAFSLALHALDRFLRLWRRWKECETVDMQIHPNDVIELNLSKKGFKAKPGQYVWVQCEEISEFEWHAFTLTKCPSKINDEDQTFSVHVKVVGDWTMKLSNLVQRTKTAESVVTTKCVNNTTSSPSYVIDMDQTTPKQQQQQQEKISQPIFRIDGPYGSPHQDSFRFPVNISIATGIGITPILATTRDLKHFQERTNKDTFKLKKIHLVWICRSLKEFTWVLKEIQFVENELKSNEMDLLDVQVFVTRDTKEQVMKDVADATINDWVSTNVYFGRPDIKEIMQMKTSLYEKERIGVFYCGSQPLGKTIYQELKCLDNRGNVMIFNKESIS